MTMRWPDIFFKAGKPPQKPASSPSLTPLPESSKPSSTESPKATETRTFPRANEVIVVKRSAPAPQTPTRAILTKESAPAQPAPDTSKPTPPLSEPTASAAPSTPPSSQSTPVEAKKIEPDPIKQDIPAPFKTLSAILHRKAKMTDVARIIPQPKPDPSAVIPPAFPVAMETGRLTQTENPAPSKPAPSPGVESPSLEKTETDPKPAEPISAIPTPDIAPVPAASNGKKDEALPTPEIAPIDPAGQQSTPSATPVPLEHLPAAPKEKREFMLANGERILGHVLSETPEAYYIDHGTLGVLTLPRSQIAQRLVEIILINGDRIVGDIMAETPDTLYVRHASLGMLTVPRAQRSTRVVEAILKDGDRILGEVLAETESFTVIRSATLGTVSVPHNKVTMLNRKIEQIELKALPPTAPAIKDKPAN